MKLHKALLFLTLILNLIYSKYKNNSNINLNNEIELIRNTLNKNFEIIVKKDFKKKIIENNFINSIYSTILHEICHHIPFICLGNNNGEWKNSNSEKMEYFIISKFTFHKEESIYSSSFKYTNNGISKMNNGESFIVDIRKDFYKIIDNSNNFFEIINCLRSIFGVIGESFLKGSSSFFDYKCDLNDKKNDFNGNDLIDFNNSIKKLKNIYKKDYLFILNLFIKESFYFFNKSINTIKKIHNEIINEIPFLNDYSIDYNYLKNNKNINRNINNNNGLTTLKVKNKKSSYLKNKKIQFRVIENENEGEYIILLYFDKIENNSLMINLNSNFYNLIKNIHIKLIK